jgi:AcrR family transcriptional regulator
MLWMFHQSLSYKGAAMRNVEADIKLRILQSAKKLFAKQGFDKTTVRQICEDAGANIALVSYHFGGKEKVFNALFEDVVPQEGLERVEALRHDPVACLKLLIEEVTVFKLSEPDLIRLLRQEMLIESPRLDTIRARIFPLWGLLRAVLEDGKRLGIFNFQSIDLALLSVLGVLLFGSQKPEFKSLLKEQPQPHQALVEHVTSFILGGLHYQEQ